MKFEVKTSYQKMETALDAFKEHLQSQKDAEYSEVLSLVDALLKSLNALQNSEESMAGRVFEAVCTHFGNVRELRQLTSGSENPIGNVSAQFVTNTLNLQQALSSKQLLECFTDSFLNAHAKSRQPAAQSRANPSCSRKFTFQDVKTYQQTDQKALIEQIRGTPLLKKLDTNTTLDTILARQLLDMNLYTEEGTISYEEFYQRYFVQSNGRQILSIHGELGVGKTQFLYWLTCTKLAYEVDNVILFLGRISSRSTPTGRKVMNHFLNRDIRKERRRKFYIIIDEIEAEKGRLSRKKLIQAAQYYQATIINVVRESSQELDDADGYYPSVSVTLQVPPTPLPLPEGTESILQKFNLSRDIIEELRYLPLFRLPIDNTLWRLKNQNLSANTRENILRPFRNEFTLLHWLYKNRLQEKEAQTGGNLNGTDDQIYQKIDQLLEDVAFSLTLHGSPVSWSGSDLHARNGEIKQFLDDGFIQNVLKVDLAVHNMEDSAINGFRFPSFQQYFLTVVVRKAITKGCKLKEVLSLRLRENVAPDFRSIFHAGMRDLAKDQRLLAQKELTHILEDEADLTQEMRAEAQFLVHLLESDFG